MKMCRLSDRKIETLYDVGLSYIRLGQPSTTLVRRRGTADQAGDRAEQAEHGKDDLYPG